jgi:hypothetical protein
MPLRVKSLAEWGFLSRRAPAVRCAEGCEYRPNFPVNSRFPLCPPYR